MIIDPQFVKKAFGISIPAAPAHAELPVLAGVAMIRPTIECRFAFTVQAYFERSPVSGTLPDSRDEVPILIRGDGHGGPRLIESIGLAFDLHDDMIDILENAPGIGRPQSPDVKQSQAVCGRHLHPELDRASIELKFVQDRIAHFFAPGKIRRIPFYAFGKRHRTAGLDPSAVVHHRIQVIEGFVEQKISLCVDRHHPYGEPKKERKQIDLA